jgi:O-antigen/teichoic acid export membrane protein
MGIWGFITMIQEYLSFSSIGVQYFLNVEIASTPNQGDYHQKLLNYTISLICIIFTILLCFYPIYYFSGMNCGSKFEFAQYLFWVLLYAGILNFQKIFVDFYRVYKNFNIINLSEFFIQALPFAAFLFYEKEELIRALILLNILAILISMFFYFRYLPFKFKFQLDWNIFKMILVSGFHFLLYNVSFYLINLISRTIVSKYFSIKELGYFSFALSITTATFFGIKTIQWAIFPQFVSKFAQITDKEEIVKYIKRMERINSTVLIVFVFVLIFCIPILYLLFPEYSPSYRIIILLYLGSTIMSLGFGFNSFILARKQQFELAKYSIFAFVIVGLFSYFFTQILKLSIEWVVISQFFGFLLFLYLQGYIFYKIVELPINYLNLIERVLPWRSILPVGFIVLGLYLPYSQLIFFCGFLLFIFLNVNTMIEIKNFVLHRYEGSQAR